MKIKLRNISLGLVVLAWAALAVFAWFKPARDMSVAERRPLTQFPIVGGENILDRSFMKGAVPLRSAAAKRQ